MVGAHGSVAFSATYKLQVIRRINCKSLRTLCIKKCDHAMGSSPQKTFS
jgi:hypothetical protein